MKTLKFNFGEIGDANIFEFISETQFNNNWIITDKHLALYKVVFNWFVLGLPKQKTVYYL